MCGRARHGSRVVQCRRAMLNIDCPLIFAALQQCLVLRAVHTPLYEKQQLLPIASNQHICHFDILQYHRGEGIALCRLHRSHPRQSNRRVSIMVSAGDRGAVSREKRAGFTQLRLQQVRTCARVVRTLRCCGVLGVSFCKSTGAASLSLRLTLIASPLLHHAVFRCRCGE
jgi:hypothetical protein